MDPRHAYSGPTGARAAVLAASLLGLWAAPSCTSPDETTSADPPAQVEVAANLPGGGVAPRHLNKHIDFHQCCAPVPNPENAKSLALPRGLAVTHNGATLYVAALGSAKVGVFSTAQLENDSFVPSTANQIHVSGGGPAPTSGSASTATATARGTATSATPIPIPPTRPASPDREISDRNLVSHQDPR